MTTLNPNTLAAIQLSQVIEQLKQDDSTLLQTYSEYAADNNYDSVFDNDYESINMMCTDSYDAIRAAFYGDYNPSHAYFTFNGYGNLQSFEYLDSDSSPIDIEELAQWIVDNDLFNEYNIEVTTLDDMLASVEDNINDADLLVLALMMDKLDLDLSDGDTVEMNGYKDLEEYYIETLIDEVSDYDYDQLNDIIIHLGINYK